MIEPRPEDIAKFSEFLTADFEQWLRLGLEGLLIDNMGVRNFRPIEYCILQEHTISGDLKLIYDAFPATQKAMVRQSIAGLIDRLPVTQEHAAIFQVLFEFAALVRAHEVLKVLPGRGEGLLSLQPQDSETASLYKGALDLVVELGDHGTEAKACIERLIGTPGSFDCRYARLALLALCRIAPDDFIQHMALLREALAENFRHYKPTQQGLHWLVNDIIRAVGLLVIQHSWPALCVFQESLSEQADDSWFREATLAMITKEAIGPDVEAIVWKAQPSVRIIADQGVHHIEESAPITIAAERIESIYLPLADERVTREERIANTQLMAILFAPTNRFAAFLRGSRK